MARLLLGVSGGIAAYKAIELARLATAREELAAQKEFPHVVRNDRLEDAAAALEELVRTALASDATNPTEEPS